MEAGNSGAAAGAAPDYNDLELAENVGNGEWRSSRFTWFQADAASGRCHT